MAEFVASPGVVVRPPPRQAVFTGSGGPLFGIYLVNVLLTLLTLGVYHFWAKNRVRAYLVAHCEFEGDRFAWHGTGRELFLGAIKLLGLVLPAAVLIFGLRLVWRAPPSEVISSLAGLAISVLLFPIAAVGARRYRFSRLSWRGIRFSFRGRVRECLGISVKGLLLLGPTLGFYLPYLQTNIRRFVTRHAHFGATPFVFEGHGGDLVGRFALIPLAIAAGVLVVGYVASQSLGGVQALSTAMPGSPDLTAALVTLLGRLAVPVLLAGLVVTLAWASYAAARHRYFWSRTGFATARFSSTMTTWKLLAFTLANLLLLVVTLVFGLDLPL